MLSALNRNTEMAQRTTSGEISRNKKTTSVRDIRCRTVIYPLYPVREYYEQPSDPGFRIAASGTY